MAHYHCKSLQELASQNIGRMIINSGKNFFQRFQTVTPSIEENTYIQSRIKEIAEYFDGLIPAHLHAIVTFHTLILASQEDALFLQNDVLGIILRSHITKFDFLSWPSEMHNPLFKSLGRLKYLKHLTLGLNGLKENRTHVMKAIQNMKDLESYQSLKCDDEFLRFLCDNCDLKSLSIRHSFFLSDASVTFLLKQQNLTKLDIYCAGNQESCLKTLLGLPRLMDVSFNKLAVSLAKISDDNIRLPFQAVKCACFTHSNLVHLTKFCPFIRKLHVYMHVSTDLSDLVSLKHLKSLILYSSLSYYTYIKALLKCIGHQMTALELRIEDVSDDAENEIKIMCPKLNRLVVNYKEIL